MRKLRIFLNAWRSRLQKSRISFSHNNHVAFFLQTKHESFGFQNTWNTWHETVLRTENTWTNSKTTTLACFFFFLRWFVAFYSHQPTFRTSPEKSRKKSLQTKTVRPKKPRPPAKVFFFFRTEKKRGDFSARFFVGFFPTSLSKVPLWPLRVHTQGGSSVGCFNAVRNQTLEVEKQRVMYSRWWFVEQFLFLPLPGEMIQFDDHIFQMSWNYQLVLYFFQGKFGRSFPPKKKTKRSTLGWNFRSFSRSCCCCCCWWCFFQSIFLDSLFSNEHLS